MNRKLQTNIHAMEHDNIISFDRLHLAKTGKAPLTMPHRLLAPSVQNASNLDFWTSFSESHPIQIFVLENLPWGS